MATSSTLTTASQYNSSELTRLFMEKLMKKICCFYDEQSLIDVTFKVSNPPSLVPAHRLILSAASPYFEKLFNGDRSNTSVIEINDFDSDIFERLITFCYTGQTLVTVDNVAAMLKAAIVLQLEEATTTCVEFLMAHINEYTLQGAYALESETQYELLQQKIVEYEIQNFMEISQREEFLNFDVEKLQCLLESDNLKVACEKDVYDAITRWFNHDVSAREEHLPRLIACLRLTQFDVDFLLTHIQALPGCELLAVKASLWIRDPAGRTKINIRFTEARVGVGAGNRDETTLLVVYKKVNAKNQCIMQFNKAEDKWEEYASINYDKSWFTTFLNDDNILFVGGFHKSSKTLKTVLSWNIRNKAWRELPAMNQARDSLCVVELDKKIYAIGGCDYNNNDNDKSLQSVERYTASNGWEFMKPLNTARYEAGAVALNGKIYLMGGKNKYDLTSVECYNPESNTWTSCADMTQHHAFPHVAAHNGFIYVASDAEGVIAVECYDPQRNIWSKTSRLEGIYCSKAFASLDNKLWTIVSSERSETREAYVEDDHCRVDKCSLPKGSIVNCFVVPLSLLS